MFQGGIQVILYDKPKYRMAVYEDKKEVHTQVLGFLKEDVVGEYIESLNTIAKTYNPAHYTLVVDATLQAPVPRKVAAELGDTMMFYTTYGYKRIAIVKPKSKIAMVQIRNALALKNFPGSFYDTVADVSRR